MALVDLEHNGLRHRLAALGAGQADWGASHIALTAPTAEDFEALWHLLRHDTGITGASVYDMGPLLTLYFDDFDGSTYEVNWYKPVR